MTITGSIGAVSAKFDLTNTLKKMGVGVETINYGKNADIFSPLSKMTKEQRDVLDGLTEHVYKDFTAKVMMSRNLNDKEIDNVARGRVFSGLDANGLKLVDEFGGILKAYEMAKKESGIAGASNLIILPRQKSPFEVFSEMFENQGFDAFLSIDSLLSILTKSNNKNKIMAKSQPVYIN
nr:MAG: putative signal peptide peptidase SppA [Alphaproteobacteria bacterium ADurb.Bin438]